MNKPRRIVITGSMISSVAEVLLRDNDLEAVVVPGAPSSAEIAEAVRKHNAVGLIVRTGIIDDQVLTASERLRVVVKHGVGTDNFDVKSATRHGIAIMIAHGVSATSVAEHALALMLAVAKRICLLDHRMRTGEWDKSVHQGLELTGKSVLLIGYGRIARRLVKLLQPFDVGITAFVRRPPENEQAHGVRFTRTLSEAIADADIISVHCPLTDLTRNLISKSQFDLMKPSAIVINTARGGIVDEDALIAALKTNRIFGAGLDCFASEPLPADSQLRELHNVVLTPHIAWATKEAIERKGCISVRNILSIINNQPPDLDCLVNPLVLEDQSFQTIDQRRLN